MAKAVRLSGISRLFGQFQANRDITLDIESGSIHAIVGENGAGKSTLTRIIYGMLEPSSGSMEINGRPARFTSPRDAIEAGIGMVHQHFMLAPAMTVTENIILGYEHRGRFSPLDPESEHEEIMQLALIHGLQIDPAARVSELSVGEEQRVEILKLLYRKAQILILDEPTAVLSPPETEKLFSTLRSLRGEGRTILLITHKLDEVLAVSDTVSVMRKGELVGTVPTATVSREDLARMMVGRNVLLSVINPPQPPGKAVLEITNLSFRTSKGAQRLNNLNLKVHEGEIYGIAGVEGNGQSELLSVLWGMQGKSNRVSGSVTVDGRNLIGLRPSEISAAGVSLIPEDRLKTALVAEYSIRDNLIFGRQREQRFHRRGGFDRHAVENHAKEMIEAFDIRCSVRENPSIASLSGGNQQKIVLAREIERPGLRLLVLAQPTRGVDIGAIELIHRKIIEARQKGFAILLVSSELEEIISLSTRIGCLFKGTFSREYTAVEVLNGRSAKEEFEKQIGLHIT